MISRIILKNSLKQSSRYFSTAAGNYESVSSENWYTPERKVEFSNKASTIFNAKNTKEKTFAAFEYK